VFVMLLIKKSKQEKTINTVLFIVIVRFEFERFGVTPLRAGLAPARPQRCPVFCGPFGGIQRGALGVAECSGWGAVPRDVVCQDHSRWGWLPPLADCPACLPQFHCGSWSSW
jgi:hypothetical protein